MKKIKITLDYLVDKLIEIYQNRNAHNDYIDLYTKQLKFINEKLNLKSLTVSPDGDNGLITINPLIAKGNSNNIWDVFNFKLLQNDSPIKYINVSLLKKTDYTKNFDLNNNYNRNEICSYLEENINHCLKMINESRKIRYPNQFCTNEAMELVHTSIKSNRNDFALNKANEMMIDIYKDSIKNSLKILYSVNFSNILNIVNNDYEFIGWDINCEIESDTILSNNLDDMDYF